VSREEAVMRIKAAVDARKESGSDIVIVARTDSRQAVSLDESLWRCKAFADVGADVLFIDALASKEEMRAFCEISPLVPKMVHYAFLSVVPSNGYLMLAEGCGFLNFFLSYTEAFSSVESKYVWGYI
jgi:2-methylisocitrate lyase-like PEP mutase family enzyme